MLQQDNIQQQIAALVRTYLTENKPISKVAILAYLREIVGVTVTEEEVEKVLLGAFARDEIAVNLHMLSITQAFLFSHIIYGIYDEDYSFIVVRVWASRTLCYATYSVTRDERIAPRMILICTKDNTILEQLRGYQMCPTEWIPLSAERGFPMIRKTRDDIESVLAAKVAELKESGPLRVAD